MAPFRSVSFQILLALALVLRVVLIFYSEWHDSQPGNVLKYTDIDYTIYTDAARYLLRPSPQNVAQGPLGSLLGVGE